MRVSGTGSGGGLRLRGVVKPSTADQPLVSVITVVYNRVRDLPATMRSVREQTYPNLEHLIVDGGSTDGTLQLLQASDCEVDYWLSERDEGVYDAMNKGIDAAAGEWLYFLGADDVLVRPDTLSSIFGGAPIPDDVDVLYGDVRYPDGRTFRSRFGPLILVLNTVHHQGAFYRRGLFDGFRYDKRSTVVADYELNLRVYLQRRRTLPLRRPIALCGFGGSYQGWASGYLAEIEVRRRTIGVLASLPFDLLTWARFGRKRLRIALAGRRNAA